MIVLTVNVTAAHWQTDANGAHILEPLKVVSYPIANASAEATAELITSALALAAEAVDKQAYKRVNATFAFENVPHVGFFVLEFPTPGADHDETH